MSREEAEPKMTLRCCLRGEGSLAMEAARSADGPGGLEVEGWDALFGGS